MTKDFRIKRANLTGAAKVIKDLNDPVEWLDLIGQCLGKQIFLNIVAESNGYPKLINMGNFDWYEVVGPPEASPVEKKAEFTRVVSPEGISQALDEEPEAAPVKRSIPIPGGENSLVIYYGGGNELELSPAESRIFISTLADGFKEKTGNAYKFIKPGSSLLTIES